MKSAYLGFAVMLGWIDKSSPIDGKILVFSYYIRDLAIP